ncbi:M1 family aminopeptidase [Sphingorhabdus sp. Alg239-R122]|uniref:M1 family aminopeptidase n=1 Tax=Sphingorhabdus sp. Alg239-R122 TaxID=2305989 RepID=UPI0013DAB345|nr:M1 family aminopeptidase [Sphingorhabdus sp. Alg239-R122]
MQKIAICLCVIVAVFFQSSAASAQEVRVEVVRDGNEWTATYRFARSSPGWALIRSNPARKTGRSWRLDSWLVETPGVTLARFDGRDLLIADKGHVPRTVQVRFTPYADDILAGYDPALAFSTGAVALFTGQFDAMPWSAENGVDIQKAQNAQVILRDRRGKVLFDGARHHMAVTNGRAGYAVFGNADILETEYLATLIDPDLPDWLSAELLRYIPATLEFYTERLGSAKKDGKPTIMVSWKGATPGLSSLGGSVLPNMVAMVMEGSALSDNSDKALDNARWFIAHESAHFWLGQTVGYQKRADMWMTEGGADLMAIRAVASINPDFDVRGELQRELDDCVKFTRNKPLGEADKRNEFRAFYACGAIFGMIAEAAAQKKGGDFFTFWNSLVAANRKDGIVTRREWLAALDRIAGNTAFSADIRTLLDTSQDDPGAVIEAMLKRAGILILRDNDGRLILS